MTSIDYEVEGVDNTVIGVRAFQGDLLREIKQIVDGAAVQLWLDLRRNAPYYEGELRDSIRLDPLVYRPGGLGGGGTYESGVTAGEGVPHFQWVVEGTGVFGPSGNVITRDDGKLMVFQGDSGDMIFTPEVQGQPPQYEWFEEAQDDARDYVARRVMWLDV